MAVTNINYRKYKVNASLFQSLSSKTNIVCVDMGNTDAYGYNLDEMFANMTSLHEVTNIPSSVTSMEATFANCQSLSTPPVLPNSVAFLGNDLETDDQNAPDENYFGCFGNCVSLETPPVIPNLVTDMSGCFYRCSSLKTLPNIPHSVTNLSRAFSYCECIKDGPSIGSRVQDMSYTFQSCYNLVNAPTLPSSVTNMDYTFLGCHNLIYCPSIPSFVNSLKETFGYCYNMVTTSIIPTSVTNMYGTFHHCTSITSAPTVTANVNCMRSAFNCCTNLTGNVLIASPNINCATYCFNGSSLRKDVYIPFVGNQSGVAMVADTDPITSYNASNGTLEYTKGYPTSYIRDTFSDKTVNSVTYYGWINSSTGDMIYTNTSSPVNGTSIPYFYSGYSQIGSVSNTYRSFLAAGYDSEGTKDNVYLRDQGANYFVLAINPTPSNATVTWTYNNSTYPGKTLICQSGTSATYTVSATEYNTATGTIPSAAADQVIDVTLRLEDGRKVDVTDYTYDLDTEDKEVTLTRYIGPDEDVDTPEAEPDDEE